MGQQALQIETVEIGETGAQLNLGGCLDLHTCECLMQAFENLFAEGRIDIIVDLKEINYMASAGFGVLIEAFAMVKEQDGSIRFTNPSRTAKNLFQMLGIMLDACDFS